MVGAPLALALLVAIGALNLFTIWLFRLDKDRAQMRGRFPPRRIPESRLLLLALMGGTPGAYAARHLLRHKTRKQPFSTQLHGIAALQIAALAALLWSLSP